MQVIEQLKERSEALDRAGRGPPADDRHLDRRHRRRTRRSARRDRSHRRSVEELRATCRTGGSERSGFSRRISDASPPAVGARVVVGGLGMEGIVVAIDGQQAEIDVRGKRLRAKVKDLRVIRRPDSVGRARRRRSASTSICKPREGLLSELNVIGCTVDQAVDRVSQFLDDTLVTDLQRDPHRPRPRHRPAAQRPGRVSEGRIRWSPSTTPRRATRAATARRSSS